MKIAIPKETYPLEKRVMLTPTAVKELAKEGHHLFVQSGAARDMGILDEEYQNAGAGIVTEPKELYDLAEMIIKVKAPSSSEFSLMHKDTILFCMFHSEQNPVQIYYAGLQGLVIVEMEKIHDSKNKRLIDQTDITGEVGVYYTLRHLEKMPYDTKVMVMGYGQVASGAIKACHKLGMKTKILRKSEYKYIQQYLSDTDLLINGISWSADHRNNKKYLVTREDVKQSNPRIIILDLSVDFPSPIETIRPTNYSQPYYIDENRIHISIYGYPGLVPVTSTRLYSEQVLPLAQIIANNSGLRGIKNRGDLGKVIYKAILNPNKYDWQKYKPEEPTGSRIE
ncbi:TPA: hypothetical protein HA242_04560 [Candidatus Woesearchaeota archaeon]|nr:hypothetical protein [Candidatus Woesearchaeota archaeon]HIG93720.1 hypothetical protein [Candidatus Woesearchaeota archaeon]HIH12970.1 hypothetical protein [Candidatus Woesearchaeota archaeon]